MKKRMQAIPTRKILMFSKIRKIVLNELATCKNRIMVKMNTKTLKRRM